MKTKKQPATTIRVSQKAYDLLSAEALLKRQTMTTVMDIWLENYIFPQVLKEKRG